MFKSIVSLLFLSIFSISLIAQDSNTQLLEKLEILESQLDNLQHQFNKVNKQNEDLLWFEKVGDIAFIDKIFIPGPPASNIKSETHMSYGNPLKFWSYVFIPKSVDASKKYPLIVLPHGGVHGDLTTYYTHIVRELMAQGYIVIAPEYRGSTGYGKSYYESIDYGGLENEDVFAARNHMVENYDIVDGSRVGIMGWSHGGMISLMSIFDHPQDYQVAFAGVPVSDLVARMGYMDDGYRALYSADYHIGATAQENIAEYRRRSPAWNTYKMKNTPLLIHTNTNDDDVNVLEVEHLIKSLKADGKAFEYEIYKEIPGGHSFDRIDTRKANEIRIKIYKFLAKELNPPNPIKNMVALRKAAYRF
ncbi:S9 family peptidase [Lentimicrobium sp. L6]|uniref:alpha/beta hydrolase family protein n=1 Tax=Lentimicrobium sp. L6 TaxID=2735916 RepID=UPI001552F647|nr:alpha/beta fold hydrolase [Lentimicrobium sp. L6]NPD83659.1 S9 family peptidase [Lentimicrobium sp. L6]